MTNERLERAKTWLRRLAPRMDANGNWYPRSRMTDADDSARAAEALIEIEALGAEAETLRGLVREVVPVVQGVTNTATWADWLVRAAQALGEETRSRQAR